MKIRIRRCLNLLFLLHVLFIICLSLRNPEIFKSLFTSLEYTDYSKGTNRSLTVVTAFFDIGNFPKHKLSDIRYVDSYRKWREAFKYLKNPLVVYTDSDEFARFFRMNRKMPALTKVEVISREELWSFKILSEIAALYSTPGYPVYYPNSYVPAYTSLTHSKLTFVKNSIKSNYLKSDYYCWLDIGYFRHIVGRKKDFFLEIPTDFDNSKIGISRVVNADLTHTTAKSILLLQKMWIASGLMLGKPDVLMKFESEYKNMVKYYLSLGLMNNEEQIIFAMNTKQERKKHNISTDMQLYHTGHDLGVHVTDPWFYLGYVMYHELPENPTLKVSNVTAKQLSE